MNLFTHTNADTIANASAALKTAGTWPIAGGSDLLTYARNMCSPNPPTAVVNIKSIVPSLAYIKEEGGFLKVGATTTLAAIAASSVVKGNYAALAQAALAVASPELRNIGTIGGNISQRPRCPYYRFEYNEFPCLRKNPKGLCYALTGVNTFHSIFGLIGGCAAPTPSDTAPVLVAMNANIVTTVKTWKAADFFVPTGEQINALAAGELITEIQVPTPGTGTKSTYLKWSLRNSIDFPMVSVAAVVTSTGGTVSSSSIVLGGVYGSPKVVTAAQDAIKGKAIDATSAAAAGTAAVTGATALPVANSVSSNKYKIQITTVYVKKALLAVK
jgi:xanthine dehydrogenase YagS FAD-binding subunit